MKRGILITLLVFCCLPGSALAEGKVLRVARNVEAPGLDPQQRLSDPLLRYSHLVFDPLIRWTQDRRFEGRLAERWERLDPLTVRFHLRHGVRFHSGNPMTARDVKWTVDRIRTSRDFKALFEVFESPEVIDDHTVDLKTSKPYPLVEHVATYLFVMDSKFYTIFQLGTPSRAGVHDQTPPIDAVVPAGYSFANENESGTGEYTVASRDPGTRWVLKRFPGYWEQPGTGNVDQIVLTPIKDDEARVAALLAGEADFIAPVPPGSYERIRAHPDLRLYTMASSAIILCQLNQKRRPELANLKVRQAIIAAVDSAAIAETIMNRTTIATQQLSPKGFVGHVEGLAPRFNLEKAKALMHEAGYGQGFVLTMLAPNNRYTKDEEIARAVAGMLARINITVDLRLLPFTQYQEHFQAQGADILMTGWRPDTEDSGNYFEYLLMCKNRLKGYGQFNATDFCNPKLDQLVLEAQSATDPDRRARMLQEVERIAADDAVFIPLHYEPLSWASRKEMNTGAVVNFLDHPYLGDLFIP